MDRIEKQLLMKAPLARVWRAISDADEFGRWFGVKPAGPFVAGQTTQWTLTKENRYADVTFDVLIERVDPQTYLSYRWHPYAVDPKVDYSKEPTTLVELRLAEVPGGTRVTITESGFDQIPAHRRAEALRMNDGGWGIQIERIRQHVEK